MEPDVTSTAVVGTIEPSAVHSGTTILDVRHHVGHHQIRGALRYDPKKLLAARQVTVPLPPGTIVLNADSLDDASAIAQRIAENDRTVVMLEGGIDAWRDAGLPVEEATQEQPFPENPDAGAHLL